MKRLLAIVLCVSIGFLPTGCATGKTFNENVAISYGTVTGVRNTATTLLNAKKISATDAENVLKQTDLAREGIELARQMRALGQNVPAENKLTATIAALQLLQTYLATKQ